jgi:HD-GYP domain-containing protein (c-di-GMP phosphodiesterase class II)
MEEGMGLLAATRRAGAAARQVQAQPVRADYLATIHHEQRVATLVAAFLEATGIQHPVSHPIILAARLHDIGKYDLPSDLLNKPGTLTSRERRIIESHPLRGARRLGSNPRNRGIVPLILYHHECWDGSGYPSGLRGEQIPFGARVIAIADSFDAMTVTRCYRAAMTPAQALANLLAGRGRQFDPDLVDAFVHTVGGRFLPIT